jgi:hypothetical protein
MSDTPAPPPLMHTSQIANIGRVAKVVLDEVKAQAADKFPVLDIFGPEEDAANAAPPSIYWAPIREGWGAPMQLGAPTQPGPLLTRAVPVSFCLFGGVEPDGTYTDSEAPYHQCDLTEVLLSRLGNAIHRLVSAKSYEFESLVWFNGGRTGIGMACELVVVFKLALIREENPVVPKGTVVPAVHARFDHGQ